MQQLLPFVSNHWELFLALTVIVALLVYQTVSSKAGGKSITPQETIRMINREQAIVLDVREPAEIKKGKILDALTIPLAKLEQQINKLEKYRGNPVVVVCQSGSRSSRACKILRKHGFEAVYNMQGGIMAWSSANLPLSKKDA